MSSDNPFITNESGVFANRLIKAGEILFYPGKIVFEETAKSSTADIKSTLDSLDNKYSTEQVNMNNTNIAQGNNTTFVHTDNPIIEKLKKFNPELAKKYDDLLIKENSRLNSEESNNQKPTPEEFEKENKLKSQVAQCYQTLLTKEIELDQDEILKQNKGYGLWATTKALELDPSMTIEQLYDPRLTPLHVSVMEKIKCKAKDILPLHGTQLYALTMAGIEINQEPMPHQPLTISLAEIDVAWWTGECTDYLLNGHPYVEIAEAFCEKNKKLAELPREALKSMPVKLVPCVELMQRQAERIQAFKENGHTDNKSDRDHVIHYPLQLINGPLVLSDFAKNALCLKPRPKSPPELLSLTQDNDSNMSVMGLN